MMIFQKHVVMLLTVPEGAYDQILGEDHAAEGDKWRQIRAGDVGILIDTNAHSDTVLFVRADGAPRFTVSMGKGMCREVDASDRLCVRSADEQPNV